MSSLGEVFPHVLSELIHLPSDHLFDTGNPLDCLRSVFCDVLDSQASHKLDNSDHHVERRNKEETLHYARE